MEPRNVEVHDTQDERLRRRGDGCLGAHSGPVGDGDECFSGAAILVRAGTVRKSEYFHRQAGPTGGRFCRFIDVR